MVRPMAGLSHHSIPLVLPEGPPEWLLVLPAGRFSGRDGRGPYTLDAAAVLAAFEAHGADLPVDFDHQTLSAGDKSGPVPVAGWITALRADQDGLWARIAWTERGATAISAREYRYISPVFRHDRAGRITALEGAGLVHYPNLHLPAAAARQDLTEPPTPMIPTPILTALGLSEDADHDAALAAIAALTARAESGAEAMARAPDPREWVPMSQHHAVAEELARLQAERRAERAETAVRAAMAAGKLAPALKDWALAYASRDPEGFAAWADAAPVIVAPAEAAHAVAPNAGTADLLTEEDRWVAAALGIGEAAFAAHKRAAARA